MTWAKLDDRFADHPKVVRAGGDAGWLYICVLCYCAGQLTNGFVPASVVLRISDRRNPNALANKLVDEGLWERVEGGYQVHDYLEWNFPADHVKAERKRKAKNAADYRARKAGNESVTNGVTGDAHGHVTASVTGDETGTSPPRHHGPSRSRPVPIPDPSPTPPAVGGGEDQQPKPDVGPEGTPAPARAPTYDVVLRCYERAFEKRHKRKFHLSTNTGRNGDESVFVRIAHAAQERGGEDAERWIRHWVDRFLADDNAWLVDNAHPPRILERDLIKYGEPKAPKPVVQTKPCEAAHSPHTNGEPGGAERAAARLQELTRGVGRPPRSGTGST